MKQKLPNIFKPDGLFKLTRLGNKFDGGYLIGESTVLESKCLISLGTGLEISFEKDYSLINKNKIFLVDNKKVSTYFKNEFLISLNYLRNFNFKPLFQSIKKFFLSNKFHNDHVFLRRHITYNSLNEILSLVDQKIQILIKIDIEIPLVLTHIHSNNIGQVDQNNNPTMIEMTFEKKPIKIHGEFKTPNKLDFKNDPYKDEIENYLD